MKKKLLASVTLLLNTVYAGEIVPYYAYVNYSKNTNKNNANLVGIYFSQFKTPYKIELDGEYLQLKYKNSPAYYQTDLTVNINYFFENSYKINFGIHNIFSSNPESVTKYQPALNPMQSSTTTTQTVYTNKYDFVLFTSFMYYKYLKYNYGTEMYYSNYDATDVIQLSPYYGFNFGNYYSKLGSFYFEGKLNIIKLTKNAAPKSSYINYDLKLQNFHNTWSATINLSLGKSAYKVAKGGFVVYNLGEEYNSNYSFTLARTLKKNNTVSATLSYSEFEESEGYTASSYAVMLSYIHTF